MDDVGIREHETEATSLVERLGTITRRLERTGLETSPGTIQQCLREAIKRICELEAALAAAQEALGDIIKADTHLVWTGGSVPEPSHEEFGTCAEIARAAIRGRPE